MKKPINNSIFLNFVLILVIMSSCGEGEPTVREQLLGLWLINNAGIISAYTQLKPHLAGLPIKNSVLEIKDDNTVIGKVNYVGKTAEGKDTTIVVKSWKGKWKLSSNDNYLHITGEDVDTSVVKHPITNQSKKVAKKFDNPLFVELEDPQTLKLTSREIPFVFKKIK